MFNERAFVRSYSSFWRDTLPYCEVYVRHINAIHAQPYLKELRSTVAASRRALVNELGFEIFAESYRYDSLGALVKRSGELDGLCEQAVKKIRRFFEYGVPPGPLTPAERSEAIAIAARTRAFVSRFDEPIVTRPSFPGCGMLDAVEGDFFVDGTLFEVKAGDRAYRGVDVRQLLVYCAMNESNTALGIVDIGFVNPRAGTFFRENLGRFCVQVSGESIEVVMGRIRGFLSSALASP